MHTLEGWLHALGPWAYPVLFLMVFAETGLLVPVPAETALVVAGLAAASGALSLPVVIACAAVAAIAGDTVAYQLGRGPGRRRLDARGRFLWLRKKHLDLVAGFFARHGGKTIFLGRFVSVLRLCGAFFAGMTDMPRTTFLAWNISGGIAWATVLSLVGYFFGAHWHTIHRWLGTGGLIAIATIALATILVARRRLEEEV